MIPQLPSFSPTAECPKCKTYDTVTVVVYRKVGRRQHLCRQCSAKFYTAMEDIESNEPAAEHIAAVQDAWRSLQHLPANRYPTIDRRGTWERIGHPVRICQEGDLAAVYRCRDCGKSSLLLRYSFLSRTRCECIIRHEAELRRRKAADRIATNKKAARSFPHSIAAMARANGISPNSARNRLCLGWDLERAVTQPIRKKDTTKPPKTSQRKTSIAEMARANGVPPRVAYLRLFSLKWDLQRAVSQPVRNKKKNRKRGSQCE